MIIDHRKKIYIFYVPYKGMGKNFDNALYQKNTKEQIIYIYIA